MAETLVASGPLVRGQREVNMLNRRKPTGHPVGSGLHHPGGSDHGGSTGGGVLKTVLLLIFLFAFSWLLIAPSYLLQPQTRDDANPRLSHRPVGILPEWVWGTSSARSSHDEVSARALAFEADLRRHHAQIMRRRFELEANQKLWSEEDEESFWQSSFGPGFGLAPKTATPSAVAAAFPTSILNTFSDRTGISGLKANNDAELEQTVLAITASIDKGRLRGSGEAINVESKKITGKSSSLEGGLTSSTPSKHAPGTENNHMEQLRMDLSQNGHRGTEHKEVTTAASLIDTTKSKNDLSEPSAPRVGNDVAEEVVSKNVVDSIPAEGVGNDEAARKIPPKNPLESVKRTSSEARVVTSSPTATLSKESAFKHGPPLDSGWRPIVGHPDSGIYIAKASKTNMAYMEMLEERAVAKPDHTHVILGESSGRLCNQLLSLSTLFTKAKINGWRVGLWGLWREIVERNFDLDLLRSYGVSFYFQDDRPQSAIRLPAATEGSCAVRKSLTWLRDFVRPNENLRRMAESVVTRLREDGQSVVTIHRRWMEGKCVLMTKKGVNHCHSGAKYVIDPNWVCNYTLGPHLERDMNEEWLGWNTTRSVSMYLSTDGQINASESTYFDPATRFKRLTTVLRSGYERLPDMSQNALPHPDASMIVDMWISTISDFYFGNPLSSCDQVVAQWRSSLRSSSNITTVRVDDVDVKDVAMYPRGCYGAFGKLETHDSDVCSGNGACTCHW